MNYKILTAVLFFTVMILSSCAETPDNVKVNKPQDKQAVDEEYVSVGELDGNFTGDYPNIKMSADLKAEIPENLYTLKLRQRNSQDKYFSQMSEIFIDKDNYKPEWRSELITSESPANICYQSQTDEYSETLVLGVNGFLYYYFNDGGQGVIDEAGKQIYFNSDNNAEINFAGSTYGVSELFDTMTGQLDKITAPIDSELDYKLLYIKAADKPDGAQSVEGYGSLSYEGVRISCISDYKEDLDPKPAPSWVEIHMSDTDSIDELNTNTGWLDILDKSECKSVLSLRSAFSKASEFLAPYNDMELKYVCMEYYPVVEKQAEDKLLDIFAYQADSEYIAEPCWAFYFDVDADKEKVLYINALNGDEYFLANNMVVSY